MADNVAEDVTEDATNDTTNDATNDAAFIVSWMLPRGGVGHDRLRQGTMPPVVFWAFCDV